jgi:TetR/AcrR family transcriptional regulator, transcriptional repressor of bet genes
MLQAMTTGKGSVAPHASRAERGERMRARLLEATIASMAHDGIAGSSIERITTRAGVSRGLVRHYYGSKDRLLAEAFHLLADNFRRMLGMLVDDGRETSDDPVLRLRHAMLPMFERLRGPRDYQYAWLGFWALARSNDEIARLNNALYEEIGAYLGTLVAAAADPEFRVDAEAAGRGLIAIMEGAWLHCLIGVGGVTVTEAEGICLDYASRLLGTKSLGDPPGDS